MKINEKLKMKIWLSTSRCYCRALKELYPAELKEFSEDMFDILDTDREMRVKLYDLGLPTRSEEIHRLYMKHMLQLSTKELELIIRADRESVIRRAPYTIDEITYELLDRSINPPKKEKKDEPKKNKSGVRGTKPVVRLDKPRLSTKRNRKSAHGAGSGS